MTADDETLLASIPLPHGQLRDVVKAWTGAELELETLEDRKVALTRKIEASDAV